MWGASRMQCDITRMMKRVPLIAGFLLAAVWPAPAQEPRLWVLRAPGEMVEYDVTTFAAKQTVKVPADAVQSPQNLAVNGLGQMLFAPATSLPLAESDVSTAHKVWFWDGHNAVTIDQGVSRKLAHQGSNQAINESAPVPYLSADGAHLFWFANEARRLQREDEDLSTLNTWEAWLTDLSGNGREDLASLKLPDCTCATGSCEESCPYEQAWAPERGVGKFFFLTQFTAGRTQGVFKDTARYEENAGKWISSELTSPLHRVLDTSGDGKTVVEAIPDTGCCGWVNESNDQTVVQSGGKSLTVFDERATYQNPDYDVSFYTANARLSPESGFVAMTIVATAEPNQPIQLAEEGEANPEESQNIRKGLAELPLVEVKAMEESARSVAHLPHATFVGWISEKEILMVEGHFLVAYNVATRARRKSTIHVEDAAHVFLR